MINLPLTPDAIEKDKPKVNLDPLMVRPKAPEPPTVPTLKKHWLTRIVAGKLHVLLIFEDGLWKLPYFDNRKIENKFQNALELFRYLFGVTIGLSEEIKIFNDELRVEVRTAPVAYGKLRLHPKSKISDVQFIEITPTSFQGIFPDDAATLPELLKLLERSALYKKVVVDLRKLLNLEPVLADQPLPKTKRSSKPKTNKPPKASSPRKRVVKTAKPAKE